MFKKSICAAIAAACLAANAEAQFGEPEAPGKGPQLDRELIQHFEIGIVITASAGGLTNIVGTTPIPIDWPEQQVKVVEEDFSPFVGKVEYRMIGDTVKQMVISIPQLPAGEECRAVVTLEITRRSLLPPDQTSILVCPTRNKMPKNIRVFLAASPMIETQNAKIKSLGKEIVAGKETDWERVRAIYDWVRENIEYKEGPLKGAAQALKDTTGDCEELTSLFIALCRVNGIPARVVWVPQHCYPEFYLEDEDGQGYWFPCQAAGAEAFGGIPEHRPILQKGDNFRTPEKGRKRMRYVAETLEATPLPGSGRPTNKFIRQAVAAPAAAK